MLNSICDDFFLVVDWLVLGKEDYTWAPSPVQGPACFQRKSIKTATSFRLLLLYKPKSSSPINNWLDPTHWMRNENHKLSFVPWFAWSHFRLVKNEKDSSADAKLCAYLSPSPWANMECINSEFWCHFKIHFVNQANETWRVKEWHLLFACAFFGAEFKKQ